MAMLVHLTSENNIKSIQRNGIKILHYKNWKSPGVYAMPVVRNFYISHQWLRELKMFGQRTFYGVYFRIPDEEIVLVGHYNNHSIEMKASEVVALIENHDNAEGYQVIVPRKINNKEIHKIKYLPQVLGWRYQPGAHKLDYCGCLVCTRPGTIRSRKKNIKWEEEQGN